MVALNGIIYGISFNILDQENQSLNYCFRLLKIIMPHHNYGQRTIRVCPSRGDADGVGH